MSDQPNPPNPPPDEAESTRRFNPAESAPASDDAQQADTTRRFARTQAIPPEPVPEEEEPGYKTQQINPAGLRVDHPEAEDKTMLPTPISGLGTPIEGHAYSTDEIQARGLNIEESREVQESTKIVRPEPSAQPEAEPEEEPSYPPEERTSRATPISGARLDEIQDAPAESPERQESEAPTQFGTPVSVASIDTIPEGTIQRPATIARPRPAQEKPKPQIQALPGEVEEIPPEQPFNMRPEFVEENVDPTTAGNTRKRARLRRNLQWIGAGVFIGLMAFVFVYLAPPLIPYPFPAVSPAVNAGDEIGPVLIDSAGGWLRQGPYYIGRSSSPDQLHVYTLSAEAPIFAGSLTPASMPRDIGLVGVVGAPELDGYVLAWPADGLLHWAPLDPMNDRLRTSFMKSPPATQLYLRGEMLFAPVTIEDWNAPSRFIVVTREGEKDYLMLIEPANGTRQQSEVEIPVNLGRVLAPPISVYDQANGNSRVVLLTTAGAALVETTEGIIKFPEGEPMLAEFERGFRDESRVDVRRARFGPGLKGWVVTSENRFASVALLESGGLRLIEETVLAEEDKPSRGSKGEGADSGDPVALTLPDANNPDYDYLIVSCADGKAYWVALDPKSEPRIQVIEEFNGLDLASADFNGDGIWDVLGADDRGAFWVMDGKTRTKLPGKLTGADSLPPVYSEVAWMKDDQALTAFYFTGDEEKPTRVQFPLHALEIEGASNTLALEWDWREGRRPL